MSQVELLLNYQQEDSKMLKLEREISSSPERKNLMQAANFVTKAAERFEALDAKARSLNTQLEELNKKFDEIYDTLSDFDNVDEMLNEGGADIAFYKKNLLQLTDKIKSLRAEVAALNKAIKESDEEYQALYQKNKSVQKQGREFQEVYEKYKAEKSKEKAEIKAQLDKIAKDIDGDVMQRYQIKRSEHIFPVLCPVKENRCSKCGSELSLSGIEKVNSGVAVECDNCHRFLYKE